jgi:hypothetical protein
MASKSSGKTLAEFRAKFDRSVVVPAKIRAALEQLRKDGPEAWEYEADFVKRAAISQSEVAGYREQFEEHVVLVRETGRNERKVWFADPKVAAKVRA